MPVRNVALLLGLAAAGVPAPAADWPQYRADPARSATTDEKLTFPLKKVWTYVPARPPSPAWPKPNREPHRIDFDFAPQPVVAAGTVYFGSSTDDTVRALDLRTGKMKWRFTTGGPVRFAPAIADGRAYVASDDGSLYCLDATTGKLVWRFRGALRADRVRVENTGRLRAVVKEFKRVQADSTLTLEFVPKGKQVTPTTAPIISGFEAVLENP